MELINILKTQFKQLKYFIIIFVSLWFIISMFMFINFKNKEAVTNVFMTLYLLSSIIFSLFFGSILYGSYAKSFIYIQNNRLNYSLCMLIWNICTTLVLTILFSLVKINTVYLAQTKFNIIMLMFVLYFSCFNIGSIYGLFVKYNNFIRKLSLLIFILIFIVLGYYTIPFIFNTVLKTVACCKTMSMSGWIISLLFINIGLSGLCLLYYNKLDIIKAYSNE